MLSKGWQRPFDDPVPLPRRRQLFTLQDAGTFITKLPKARHDAPEWLAAMEALLLVAEPLAVPLPGRSAPLADLPNCQAPSGRLSRVFRQTC
jgi:hypothetical protein